MTNQVQIYATKRSIEVEVVDFSDLISITDAAELRGVSTQAISQYMASGDLPEYFMQHPDAVQEGRRVQRMTSRAKVLSLPKAKGGRLVSFAAAKNNPKRLYSPRYFQSTPLLSKVTSSFQSRLPLFSAN